MLQELKEVYDKKAKVSMNDGEWSQAVKVLTSLIHEWDKIIIRPYKDITSLEKDLRMSYIFKHQKEENDWTRQHS